MQNRLTEVQKQQIDVLNSLNHSSRYIAKKVLGSKSKKSTINDYLARTASSNSNADNPKILVLDIETSATENIAFGRFNINLSQDNILKESLLMCVCAKWLGDETMLEISPTQFRDWDKTSEQRYMLTQVHRLLCEADYVIAHNGKRFDIPVLNAQMVLQGLSKPTPYRIIDTLHIARRNFKFPSNKLDSLGSFLNLGRKTPHTGISMWKECMQGDKDSWKLFLEYCAQDVWLLEEVYMKLRPWDSAHPNLSVHYNDTELRCGVCTSTNLSDTGEKAYTDTSQYSLYKCGDCGAWHRTRFSEFHKTKSKALLKGA